MIILREIHFIPIFAQNPLDFSYPTLGICETSFQGIHIRALHCLLVFHLLSSLVCCFCFSPKFNEHNFLCLELSSTDICIYLSLPFFIFLLKYHVLWNLFCLLLPHNVPLFITVLCFVSLCIMYYFETYIYLLFLLY